uniref:tumor protein p53-inducible nuclear protein 2 isoform X2 n=1 Tax=Doryrhamphus excisus TaxID=161450 RepID=UPI0025AEB587|nr:tumor protein p53-inducible nuclear protein 2 isoform X2 [Doryrhamphus excisus]
MLKRLARLLFGGQEAPPGEVQPEEVVEEEWLVVSHQEAASAGTGTGSVGASSLPPDSDPNTVATTPVDTDASVTDPESEQSTDQSGGTASKRGVASALLSPPEALQELTKLTCRKASRTSSHCMSRNAIQRQNRVRQGCQQHSFPLQQPGHRTLSH